MFQSKTVRAHAQVESFPNLPDEMYAEAWAFTIDGNDITV